MEKSSGDAPCEMTQEQAEMEARRKRVKQAAKKIAAVIVAEGISAFDLDWATQEAKSHLVFALAASDS